MAEARLDCWHQKADCSTEEYPGISPAEAVAKFHAIDWSAGGTGDDDDDGCVPGFGVYLADGSKLDLRHGGGRLSCDFHYEDRDGGARTFSSQKVAHSDSVSMAGAEKLIKAAYAGDHRAILAELGGAQK